MSDSSGTHDPPDNQQPGTSDREASGSRQGTALQNTPNAERYVLEADAMRRRQLRSALLHGSRRTWREHRRAWPPVVVGLIVVAVIVAGLAVKSAFDTTQENQRREERQQQREERQREQEMEQRRDPSPPPQQRPPTTAPTGAGGSGDSASGEAADGYDGVVVVGASYPAQRTPAR